MSAGRLRANNEPSTGFIPLWPGSGRNIDAGFRPGGGGMDELHEMMTRQREAFHQKGSGRGRGGVNMAANDFHQRRDRGWRRGWPFRHQRWVPLVVGPGRRAVEGTGTGYRGVGNIHIEPGMRPPRVLLGLLPKQTSDYKPFRYPLG